MTHMQDEIQPVQGATIALSGGRTATEVNAETLPGIVAEALGLKEPLSLEFLKVAFENAILFDRKHQDYGPNNISAIGSYGVICRALEKCHRLLNLFKKRQDGRSRKTATGETMRDSFKDISNFGIIAEMTERGLWK